MAGELQTIITPNLVTADKPKDIGERGLGSEIIKNPLRDPEAQAILRESYDQHFKFTAKDVLKAPFYIALVLKKIRDEK